MISTAERTVVVQVQTPLAVAKAQSHSNQAYEGLEAHLGFLERRKMCVERRLMCVASSIKGIKGIMFHCPPCFISVRSQNWH